MKVTMGFSVNPANSMKFITREVTSRVASLCVVAHVQVEMI